MRKNMREHKNRSSPATYTEAQYVMFLGSRRIPISTTTRKIRKAMEARHHREMREWLSRGTGEKKCPISPK